MATSSEAAPPDAAAPAPDNSERFETVIVAHCLDLSIEALIQARKLLEPSPKWGKIVGLLPFRKLWATELPRVAEEPKTHFDMDQLWSARCEGRVRGVSAALLHRMLLDHEFREFVDSEDRWLEELVVPDRLWVVRQKLPLDIETLQRREFTSICFHTDMPDMSPGSQLIVEQSTNLQLPVGSEHEWPVSATATLRCFRFFAVSLKPVEEPAAAPEASPAATMPPSTDSNGNGTTPDEGGNAEVDIVVVMQVDLGLLHRRFQKAYVLELVDLIPKIQDFIASRDDWAATRKRLMTKGPTLPPVRPYKPDEPIWPNGEPPGEQPAANGSSDPSVAPSGGPTAPGPPAASNPERAQRAAQLPPQAPEQVGTPVLPTGTLPETPVIIRPARDTMRLGTVACEDWSSGAEGGSSPTPSDASEKPVTSEHLTMMSQLHRAQVQAFASLARGVQAGEVAATAETVATTHEYLPAPPDYGTASRYMPSVAEHPSGSVPGDEAADAVAAATVALAAERGLGRGAPMTSPGNSSTNPKSPYQQGFDQVSWDGSQDQSFKRSEDAFAKRADPSSGSSSAGATARPGPSGNEDYEASIAGMDFRGDNTEGYWQRR